MAKKKEATLKAEKPKDTRKLTASEWQVEAQKKAVEAQVQAIDAKIKFLQDRKKSLEGQKLPCHWPGSRSSTRANGTGFSSPVTTSSPTVSQA